MYSQHKITVFITHKHLAAEHLVVSKDVVQHLLVKILRWILESYLHPASLLSFEIDIAMEIGSAHVEKTDGNASH